MKTTAGTLALMAALVAGGCGTQGGAVADAPTPVEATEQACIDDMLTSDDPETVEAVELIDDQDIDYEPTFTGEVSDEGRTIVVRGAGQDDAQVDRFDAGFSRLCVLREMGAPQGLRERMKTTRAMDGTQTADEVGHRWTWTYHPDQGGTLIVEESPDG